MTEDAARHFVTSERICPAFIEPCEHRKRCAPNILTSLHVHEF